MPLHQPVGDTGVQVKSVSFIEWRRQGYVVYVRPRHCGLSEEDAWNVIFQFEEEFNRDPARTMSRCEVMQMVARCTMETLEGVEGANALPC